MLQVLLLDALWSDFIGRFHPAIVHFPIGFLLIAAVLEVGRRWGKIDASEQSISLILFWSAVTATIACIAGFLLSSGGGYDEDLLNSHMWKGIAVAVLAWVAWLFKSNLLKKTTSSPKIIYLPALLISTALTMITGHDGGTLTHGKGYLTQYTPEPFRAMIGLPAFKEEEGKLAEIKPITDVKQAVVYADIVRPILENKCAQCHSESKQKGELRVDELAFMIKGGKSGPALVAGSSANSDLVKRCLLPESDEKHMPPKGKPQLSTEQIALLSWWIDQGAPADKKVAELTVPDALKPALSALSGAGNTAPTNAKKAESAVLSVKVPEANVQAIENLRKVGLIVNELSQDQNLVEVSAVNAPNFSDKEVELLKPLAQQIAWLKLGGTKITDAALDQISKFPHIAKLHLEHTSVSDKGITALKGLKYLEYLNVIDTKVGDAGLKTVAEMAPLRSVYVWQSAVTDSAVAQVARAHPELMVVNGFNEAVVAEFLKAGDTTAREQPKKK